MGLSETEELTAQLALNRVAGVGSATSSKLLQSFTTACDVFNANRQQLSRIQGISTEVVDSLVKGILATEVEKDLLWLEESPSHNVILLNQPAYPALLSQIHSAPPVLFLKGNAALITTVQLAIVGSRNPTPGGKENARAFARSLAATGLSITSGLADGVDGAAHRGALDVTSGVVENGRSGRTLAVAATGLDRIYPSQHRELAHEIAEQGLLVSEFPIGMGPLRANFPRRNRLISGLSVGVLVVEAARKSGSLITARYAMEQGREVFAIPGSIHSPLAKGCHWLIQQGAKLVETAEDIAEEILSLLPARQEGKSLYNQSAAGSSDSSKQNISKDQQQLLSAIGFDPVTVDLLLSRTSLTIEELSVLLSQLELLGEIDSLPGGRYICRGSN